MSTFDKLVAIIAEQLGVEKSAVTRDKKIRDFHGADAKDITVIFFDIKDAFPKRGDLEEVEEMLWDCPIGEVETYLDKKKTGTV